MYHLTLNICKVFISNLALKKKKKNISIQDFIYRVDQLHMSCRKANGHSFRYSNSAFFVFTRGSGLESILPRSSL